MTHRILITALYGDASNAGISYYGTKDSGERTLYCDAAIPSEAGCKYILSSYPIDEIIVFGTEESRCGDETPAPLLKKEQALPADLEKLSEYCILQYRLTQFFEDISLEDADRHSLLTEEEQKQTVAFLRRFFRERADTEKDKKFSRFFHYLIQDPALREEFAKELREWVPEDDAGRYQTWILQYLYRDLKATSKLEPLDRNGSVRIRYTSVEKDSVISLLDRMLRIVRELEVDDGVADTTELYICLQNDHAAYLFMQMNAMNLVKVLPGTQIRICRVITETPLSGLPIHELCDMTDEYNISELLAGTGAFLSYGKTDLLVEYWERAKLYNPKIEKIIYAMRNIDSGISLCDIADLERGIRSLRSVIKNDLPLSGETVIEQYFEILLESIREDYGALLEEDHIPFIDLVKWAYRKGFLQQTLTLVESRAPGDFVDRGLYFYSDGERTHKHAVEVLGQAYYDLKPYEKYKLDDVSHYYIKYYGRNRASRAGDGDAYQMNYTGLRIEELDTHDESILRGLTVCPDRAALKDLLFAYYHLGDVRNLTNHAAEEYGGFYTIMPDTDPGERMKVITQAIEFFIHCYDRVAELIEGQTAHVVTVKTAEIADYARTLRDAGRRDRN